MTSEFNSVSARGTIAREAAGHVRLLSRRSAMMLAGTAAIALAVAATPATAIVINDNFNPNLPPVVTNQFANTVSINGGGCTGTLISSTLVLTAAHCFFNPAGQYTGQNVNVSFGAGDPGQSAAAVIANPGFNPRGSSNQRGGTNFASDIAIVVLSRNINNVTPVNLQLAPNVVAAGIPTFLVGFGGSGTASGPRPLSNDDRRRVAQTLIGNYVPLNQLPVLGSDSPQNVYAAQFRNPNNPNQFNFYQLAANPPAQQGGTAPGDSGGPLFYCPIGNNALANCAINELVQIGVQIGGGQPAGGGNIAFGYGDISAWTPTALFAGFINGNGYAEGTSIISPNGGDFAWSNPGAWVNGERPGNMDVAWLQNAGTITLDVDATVSALWVTGEGSQFSIPAQRTMTATTNTILENGILTVNGTLNSPLVGITGGVLNGAGIITAPGGTLVSNVGGTVAPGTANAIGTLTIQGDYFQGPGGTLQVRLAGAGSDRLVVTGQADLDGTLTLARGGGTFVAGTSYTILSAGTRLNTFATAAPLQLTWDLAATTVYTANGVNVNVIRTANFESVARTPNDLAIARALDAAAGNPGLAAILARIDNGSAAQADVDFDQLEGALVGNHLVANLAGARAVQSALDRHLAELRDDTVGVVQRAAGVGNWTMSYAAQSVGLSFGGGELPPQLTAAVADARASATGFASRWDKSIAGEPRAYSAWMQGIGAWQTLRGDNELPGLSQSVGGLIGGIDANPFAAVLPTLKSGMAFAYTRGNLNSGLDQGWTEAYRVAFYAVQSLGAAFVQGHVGYSYDNMGTTRSIPFAALAPAGSTHGSEFSATIAAGYRQWVGHLLLEPVASIAYDYVNRAAYTETGADAIGLAVNDASLDSLRFSVGGRALANVEFAGGVLARPELRARYEYDALNPLPASSVAFAGVPLIPFTITGVQPARNAAVLGAGLTVSKGEAISAFADYNADLRSNETVQTALAGVRIRW